jgi:hypothetical protein
MILVEYLVLVPIISIGAVGAIAFSYGQLPSRKKFAIILLSAIAIGSGVFSIWWTEHERTERALIRQNLEQFVTEGEVIANSIKNNIDKPVPDERVKDWEGRASKFVDTLGPSYESRFESDPALSGQTIPGGDTIHNSNWATVISRIYRLREFEADFSY